MCGKISLSSGESHTFGRTKVPVAREPALSCPSVLHSFFGSFWLSVRSSKMVKVITVFILIGRRYPAVPAFFPLSGKVKKGAI